LASLLLAADKPFNYPQPPKSDQTDDYFGTKVADPYRDLENVDADATKKWIEAENKLTFDYLETIPERKKIKDKMTALWNYVKFSNGSWKKDGSGFFYSRYDAPASAEQLKQANYFHKLYFHKLGTPQPADPLVYERKDHKDWNFNGEVSEDGRFLIINVSQGTDPKNRIFYMDLQKPDATVVELLNKQDAAYDFLGCDGNVFWFKTDLAAPRGRIVAIDITKPEEVKTLVPE